MLHRYQATSADNLCYEDICHILHPDSAVHELAFTAKPNQLIRVWDLPIGYSQFVNSCRQFHYQYPWMAYRDVLEYIKSGKVVLLRQSLLENTITGVLTASGNLRHDLPLLLQSRLSYLISHQLNGITSAVPVQHAQTTKTLNSKGAGRLLAAGGIYNGNSEGFRKTAEDLGGEAPDGYNQIMANRGLLIAGASVTVGLSLGRMRFPELEELKHFGARGVSSGRQFEPELAGGPIENLTTDGVEITHEGIKIVEKHLSRFAPDPGNDFMMIRLRKIADGELSAEKVDLNYYTHECREYQRYCNLGWETGRPADDAKAYDLWNNTHTATLEDYRITGDDLYHPDAPLW
ncbi:hypothetical protein C3D80_14640 [Cronobacter sakazakii]|uniref:Uncharacterized protein n=1 Tax=Cronobacter sakazakii (strain ATCC BAA-894) TaxID=290339 RepID=A7MG60_CROS8|nr:MULTISPECIES: hypothetical protein [Cronobacter]ABU78646.1 hypothetical protein ESA_03428 [Cronobacter sakazakii ATCC BAA-894]AFK00973.1 hypothetical protein ES15_3399 [Cronobacter sakazakii ES15]AXX00703.1 hypothetical protein CsakCS09_01335 [Cronobacter sakazakii]EGT4322410.1 hypothetical protein [Cronobacter sakazakii]EGT4950864.1 hypothetical protein [Cronobacter sakazakii]